jgi:hypothetical protein
LDRDLDRTGYLVVVVPMQRGSLSRCSVDEQERDTEPAVLVAAQRRFSSAKHAAKDQSNRRKYMPDYAVWEIHPVMKLDVQ